MQRNLSDYTGEDPWEEPTERRSDGPLTWSLFSGIGGMDLGFEQAGYNIQLANEVDPNQAATHRANFPEASLLEDSIHLLSTDDLVDRFGHPDVIIGAFPCVTYSKAAFINRKRHSDARPKRNYSVYAEEGGDLFLHYRRFVADTQPQAFVVENVTDLMGCRIIMETLKNTPCPSRGGRLGRYYTFVYGTVDTQDFGIAQRRKRMFVIGLNKETDRPTLRTRPLQHTHTVGSLLEEDPDVPPLNGKEMPNYIKRRITGEPSPRTGKPYRDRPSVKKIGDDVIGNTCLAHYAKDQGTTMVEREDGTITSYSIREYANLQGFPSSFELPKEKHTYRGIGNAVSVPVARAVGEAIMPLLV